MNKKTVNVVLALVLLAAFFLPYISFLGTNINGFQIVFGKNGGEGIGGGRIMFLCLLIPIGSILILISALGEKSSTLQDYVFWMPLIGIVFLTVMMYIQMNKGAQMAGGGDLSVGEYVKVMGYGYWITVVAAIAVLVNKNKK